MSSQEALCLDEQVVDIICFVWSTLFLIACLTTTYKFIIAYRRDKKSNKSHVAMRNSIIVASIILVVSAVGMIATNLALVGSCLSNVTFSRSLSNALFGVFWLLHSICVVMVFIVRLYDVFDGTSYAYSKTTFRWLVGSVIVSIISALIGMVFLAVFRSRLGLVFAALGLFIYMFVSVATLGLFVYGLYKVSVTFYLATLS